MQIDHRHLKTQQTRAGRLLAAVRDGEDRAVCFFKSDVSQDALTDVDGFRIDAARSVGGGRIASGQTPPGPTIPLPLASGEVAHLQPVETDLFAGLNTVVALRGVESAEVIAD